MWEFADHKNFKTINQIQLLDVPGDVTRARFSADTRSKPIRRDPAPVG